MEVSNGTLHSRKRKLREGDEFPLNELNQDLLERVLSWLPTSSFFRFTSVCKRWKSAATSASFMLACSQVPARRPWFFMVPPDSRRCGDSIVFDSAEGNWKKLNHAPPPSPLVQNQDSCSLDAKNPRHSHLDFILCRRKLNLVRSIIELN